ncbi:MAG: hypothetical protein A2046_15635 [Bacteroidetes bacterium GWA2_30_7]|nr:MAG: hypothetical protein A2046_15635 [Bacteroidetes bacterium GWA2_30_7]
MKIIVSHDIDHLTIDEHWKDLVIPKFIIRMHIELILGKISLKEFILRIKYLFINQWQNLNEIMEFDKSENIPSTFFIGVNNGVGLSYSLNNAEKWIKQILNNGFDCGVHGISYQNYEEIKKEFDTFQKLSNLNEFGIRMHYLRNDKETLNNLSKAGYIFDSTDYKLQNPYFINNMIEFPLHIMEGYEIESDKRWQNNNLEQAKQSTIQKINTAKENNIEYLTILFHDRYFNNSFNTWKEWYKWVIKYCKEQNFEFINYRQAKTKISGQ